MSHFLTGPTEVLSQGYWRTTSSGGVVTSGSPFYYPSSYRYSEAWGHRTPRYYELLKRGAIVPYTTWVQTHMDGECAGVYNKRQTSTSYKSEIVGFAGFRPWYPSFPAIFPTSFAKAGSFDLVQKAAANTYKQGFDLGVFVAEAKKTAAMVAATAEGLAHFAKTATSEAAIRRVYGVPKTPAGTQLLKKLLKNPRALIWAITSAWLEQRYGWRPLMKDLEDLAVTCILFDKVKDRFSSNVQEVFTETPNPIITSANEGEYVSTTTVVNTANLSMRGGLIADIKPAMFRMNPVTTLYELMPYSFVLDWIWDVGQALEALSFLSLARSYTAANGFKLDCEQQSTHLATSWTSGWTGEVTQTSYFKASYVKRIPTLVSWLPQSKVKISNLHAVDALALVFQLFGKKKGTNTPAIRISKFDLNDL